MKLRIKGESLRLRVSRSDLERLMQESRIDETIHFGSLPNEKWTYALELGAKEGALSIRYAANEVAVILSNSEAKNWVDTDAVGVYGEVEGGAGSLELIVEKDFACLDRQDGEDADAFPNPKAGRVC
jgi:uncharacterized protein DUF7009